MFMALYPSVGYALTSFESAVIPEAKSKDNDKRVNYTGVNIPHLDIGYLTCTIPLMVHYYFIACSKKSVEYVPNYTHTF